MISGCKAAVFDLDGTLLDSMRQWRFSALEFLLAEGIDMSDDVLAGVFNRSGFTTIKMAYETGGLDFEKDREHANQEILKHMQRHYATDVNVKSSSVVPFLNYLRALGIRMCIATATPKKYALNALARHGIEDYFEFIFDESDAGCNKSNSLYFEKVAAKLGLSLSECVMFEDALYSIKTCHDIGLKVVAIEDKCALHVKDKIIPLADMYIKDYSELM